MMRKGTGDSSTSFNNYMVKGGSEAELSNGDSEIKNHKLCYGGGDADDLLSSWPPRHYTCSFCRRRFKSAQALGGHMNVHRRARAMLRSQSMSPISSPPSSPWLHRTLTTAPPHHPFQHDHFIYPNPHCPSNHINLSHSNLSHLPIITITPSITVKHKNPLSAPYKHLPETQFQHAELSHDIEKVKKYCFRAENSSTTVHQDDAVVRLSLGGSRPAVEEEDIDLELRLGF